MKNENQLKKKKKTNLQLLSQNVCETREKTEKKIGKFMCLCSSSSANELAESVSLRISFL